MEKLLHLNLCCYPRSKQHFLALHPANCLQLELSFNNGDPNSKSPPIFPQNTLWPLVIATLIHSGIQGYLNIPASLCAFPPPKQIATAVVQTILLKGFLSSTTNPTHQSGHASINKTPKTPQDLPPFAFLFTSETAPSARERDIPLQSPEAIGL